MTLKPTQANMWTAVCCLLLVAPFIALASNLKDGDEAVKGGFGIGLIAIAAVLKKLFGA